jgi:hypothetical protein
MSRVPGQEPVGPYYNEVGLTVLPYVRYEGNPERDPAMSTVLFLTLSSPTVYLTLLLHRALEIEAISPVSTVLQTAL